MSGGLDRCHRHEVGQAVHDLRGCKRCRLAVVNKGWRHLDYITSDDLQAFQALEDGQEFSR